MINYTDIIGEEIYRYTSPTGDVSEYRFKDGICIGTFVNSERGEMLKGESLDEGKPLSKHFKTGLKNAGFILIPQTTNE